MAKRKSKRSSRPPPVTPTAVPRVPALSRRARIAVGAGALTGALVVVACGSTSNPPQTNGPQIAPQVGPPPQVNPPPQVAPQPYPQPPPQVVPDAAADGDAAGDASDASDAGAG